MLQSLQPHTNVNLLPRDGEVLFVPQFFSHDEAAALFAELRATLAWSQPEMQIFGRRVPVPRLEAWYGDAQAAYTYSGIAHEPLPWTPALSAILVRVESAASARFNSVLANLYRDGSDSNGWHADDERELGHEPTIASLSLGATRRFLLRRKRDRNERIELALEAGSLLIMRGLTQECWQHSVPKQRGVQSARINLTFRSIVI